MSELSEFNKELPPLTDSDRLHEELLSSMTTQEFNFCGYVITWCTYHGKTFTWIDAELFNGDFVEALKYTSTLPKKPKRLPKEKIINQIVDVIMDIRKGWKK